VQTLGTGDFDIAFADPPYKSATALALAEHWLTTPFSSLFGVEHSSRDSMPAGGETRRYGASAITFYRVSDPAE
jgi:16S rRNA (guanine966-N2)-methyltransferase